MSKRALMVIDVQNDYFPNGKWPLVGIDAAAKNAARIISACREKGDFVVHIRHEFTDDSAPFFTPNSDGAKTHSSVLPLANEPTVLKHRVNAFLETDLKALLDSQNIEDLVIVGNMSHMCIDAATRAASDLGYNVTVVQDACATHEQNFGDKKVAAEDVHAVYMSALAFAYATLTTTEEFS